MMQGLVVTTLAAWLSCAVGAAWANPNPITAMSTVASAELVSPAGGKADILPLEVTLNGDKVVAQGMLRTPKGPALSELDAKQARLQWAGDAFSYENESWVLLSQCRGLTHSFDEAAARLSLKVAAQDLATQKVESPPVSMAMPTAIPAVISNYDWYHTSFSGTGPPATATSVVVEHIASLGALRFNQSWAANWSSQGSTSKWTRIDTGLRYDDLAATRTWWVGDNFTSSQTWGRAYRLLGAGVQSNFAGRPDIQVLPRPAVSGFLVEPSSYELFLDNKKVGKGQFESGHFEINSLPAVSANGDVRVVLQDALGREYVQAVPFFIAPRQLAENLQDYQFNAGRLRKSFTGDASDYGDWVMAGEYGRGLSDIWTVRAASELAKNQANVGLRHILSLWGVGSLTLDTAVSKNQGQRGWYVAAQSTWARYGVRLSLGADRRSRDFWRIGDSLTTTAQREMGYSSTLGFGLGSYGSVALAAALENRFDGSRIKNISATYSKQLSDRAFINVTGNFYSNSTKSKSLYVMFNYSFDGNTPVRVLTSAQKTETGTNLSVGVSRDATADLPVAASISMGKDSIQNSTGSVAVSWTPEPTSINLNVSVSQSANSAAGTQTNVFASGSGSVTATSYGIFPSARIYDSAVLIDLAGSPQVRTHVGGQSVKTNDAGYALVPQGSAYMANQAMFEPSDLPLEMGFSSQVAFVTPWPRSVAVVKFDIANTEGESFRVLDNNSKPIKVGSEVLLSAEDNQFIGRDGYLYLSSRAKGNEVKIKTPESIICTAKLPERKAGQARSDPITVLCD